MTRPDYKIGRAKKQEWTKLVVGEALRVGKCLTRSLVMTILAKLLFCSVEALLSERLSYKPNIISS